MHSQNDLKTLFKASARPHVLMITNHGIHDFEVRSGLKDTGGQNHYVNALADTLVELGYRVTTFNRGGFKDPVSGERREGAKYKNENNRIVYLEGGGDIFIRKEDLNKKILSEETDFAKAFLANEATTIDLIISHYWDGALLGCLIKQIMNLKTHHIFIPHSLGALKKENFRDKPKEVIASLNFDERISHEKEVIEQVSAVGSTSGDITRFLRDFYNREPEIFLPPCIDTKTIHPIGPGDCHKIYEFLFQQDPISGINLKGRPFLLEISRTDQTKRKDVVINAFKKCLQSHPDAVLLLTISRDSSIYGELMSLIDSLGIRKNIVTIGTVPRDIVSELYSISNVYCSPSEMEGFGMSVQEACACKKPVVTSNLVPFSVEYLLKNSKEEIIQTTNGPCNITWGEGGVVVPAGNVDGFAHAINRLLSDQALNEKIAEKAYKITIPYFTWKDMTERMLNKIKTRSTK